MRTIWILLAAGTIAACADSSREAPPTANAINWTAVPLPEREAPDGGSLIDVELRARMEPGWKLYALTQEGGGPVAMTVKLDSGSQYTIDAVNAPEPVRALDPNFNIETQTYSDQPVFKVTVKVPSGTDRNIPAVLKVRSQICSDRVCLPARTTTLSVPLKPLTS